MPLRFIVSPAKKMNVVDDAFAWRDLPAFLDRTESLMEAMRGRSYDEAKALWRCSDALAQLNHERFRTMDLRGSSLTPAVLAYEGIQYQHLAPQVMEAAQLDYLQEHLRILSGFYGVLRPFDGVVPYRLEMQAKLGVGDAQDLYAYWGDALCRSLAQEADTIVNLASVEYAKAVLPHVAGLFRLQQASGGHLARTGPVECGEPEPKRARTGAVPPESQQMPAAPHAPADLPASTALPASAAPHEPAAPHVVTCLFGAVMDGKLVQRSTAAKAARGSMVRWCAENNVRRVADLLAFDVAGYAYDKERSSCDCLVFVRC